MTRPLFMALVLAIFFVTTSNAQISAGKIYLVDSQLNHDSSGNSHRLFEIIVDPVTHHLQIALDDPQLNGKTNFNFQLVGPSGTMSARFTSTALSHTKTESGLPHAGFGDVGGDYHDWSPISPTSLLGNTIDFKAEYFSASGGGGSIIGTANFTITFVQTSADNDAPSPVPSVSSVSNVGEDSVVLNWTSSNDPSGIKEYKIYAQTGGSGNFDYKSTSSGTGLTATVTGLTPSTAYAFKVTAVDDSPQNNESNLASSIASNSITTLASSGGGSSTSVWTESNSIASYSGNVAVGTTAVPSGFKMAVDGNIVVEEVLVKTSNNWPDYVFLNDYKLPTLEEVKKHIEEKGHLINIPSAEQVKTNGIELGDMNRLLLEKIEELTLYIIELEERTSKIEQTTNKQ